MKLEKIFINDELNIELASYIDAQQNKWFRGKNVAKILRYSDTTQALWKIVSKEHKNKGGVWTTGGLQQAILINEPGFYELVFGSKLETAKKFRNWVFEKGHPSIRKYGQYKLFDNPNNKMFKIENETDLHCKVVEYIRRFYPEAIILAGMDE